VELYFSPRLARWPTKQGNGEIRVNWEAMGAFRQVAGAVGAIVTSIYLATQMKQNTRASRLPSIQLAVEGSAKRVSGSTLSLSKRVV
jgi:hypothetical protein